MKDSALHAIAQFLKPRECEGLLRTINDYRLATELPMIYRPAAKRSLKYRVIDGERIHKDFPQLQKLYTDVNELVRATFAEDLVPLVNRAATINVNIIPPAGEYRWHYDRNAATAVLFLNEVAGGETEIYPKYRIRLGSRKHNRAQQWLDHLLCMEGVLKRLGKKVSIAPRQGLLVLMRGDRCLHSVRPVEGDMDRISIVMAYDLPGATHPQQQDLDPYLYTPEPGPLFDPNYQR